MLAFLLNNFNCLIHFHAKQTTYYMRANCTSLKLNSNPTNIQKLSHYVETIVKQYRIRPDAQGDILISLTEAVNNAIIHGNRKDEKKFVEVTCTVRQASLSIEVKDEGKGFDYNNLPDPTSKERICECGGRGVYLMRQLSKTCKFHNKGNTVEMEFPI